jgi:hypothetical protein
MKNLNILKMTTVTNELNLQASREPSFHSEFNRQIHPAEPEASPFDEVNDSQPHLIFDKESPLSQGATFELIKNKNSRTNLQVSRTDSQQHHLAIHPTEKEVYSSFAEVNDLDHHIIFDQESAVSLRSSVVESNEFNKNL